MTTPKRSKRIKPDPALIRLTDNLLVQYQTPEELLHGDDGLRK